MRFKAVVFAYVLWLFAVFGAVYFPHGRNADIALQLALLAAAIPVGLQLVLLGIDWHGLVVPARVWLAFLIIVLFSYLISGISPIFAPQSDQGPVPAAWTPVVYTLNLIFVCGIGTIVAGCPERRLLRSIASVYCILLTPFLVYVDLTGKRGWGNRLEANDLQPNVWGVMGLTVCLGVLARKKIDLISAVCFASGSFTMIAASSRESIIAVVAALLVVGVRDWRTIISPSRRLPILAVGCAFLILVTVCLDTYFADVIRYLRSDILVLDDPNRGVNSGFTGRTGVWEVTYNVWLNSPLFGVGYRMHERFLPEGVQGHSAYLAMLADTGILGFVWYLLLMIVSVIASFGMQDQATRRFVTAMIVARFVSGFFDRVTINGGNTYGLLFIICCSVALADQSLRTVSSLFNHQRSRTPALKRT